MRELVCFFSGFVGAFIGWRFGYIVGMWCDLTIPQGLPSPYSYARIFGFVGSLIGFLPCAIFIPFSVSRLWKRQQKEPVEPPPIAEP
jgi:hypothetical protein